MSQVAHIADCPESLDEARQIIRDAADKARRERDAHKLLHDLVAQECDEKNQAQHELEWLRRNCRVVYYPPGTPPPYPIEHAPHANKDQWNALMAAAGDCPSRRDGK